MITASEARERSQANDRTRERQSANTDSLLKACEKEILEAVSHGHYTAAVEYQQPVDLVIVSEDLRRHGYNVPIQIGGCGNMLVFGWHKS